MILVDTCVWVDHLARRDELMASLLERKEVAIHPFVIGEIALGSLRSRARLMSQLNELPRVAVASDREVVALIEGRELFATRIGYVDAHLLASTIIADDAKLWTRDGPLGDVAERLGVAARLTN